MAWFMTLSVLLVYCIGFLRGETSISETQCYAPSMVDFVKESLPKLCFGSESAGFLNYTMNEVEFYNAHCRVYQEIKECLETKLKHCDQIRNGFRRHVLNLVESYQLPLDYFDYDANVFDDDHYLQNLIPFCDGAKLSGYFSQKFDRSLLSCLTNNTLRKHEQCLKTFQSNIQTVLLTRASLQEINKWSEDFLRCVYNSMPTHCSSATKEVFVFKELLAVKEKQNSSTPTALNITKIVKQQLPGQDVQGFAQSKRATSSIHGDPHIVQLHTTQAVTCKLLGNRTYIGNPHFKITGIAKHVGDPSLTATALTSLQIDFFDSNGHLIAYYRASNGKLPLQLSFVDSSSSSLVKIDHGEHHASEGHLTLTHAPTSTQITVNTWSKFHFFLVRSSELLLNNSNGYLITGCPPDEIIDRQAIIARLRERFARSQKQVLVQTRQRRSVPLRESDIPAQCELICSSNGNDFPEECLFDCLAFASINVTQALNVHEMHSMVSRERRQLVENDQRVVNEFEECYRKGVVCKKIKDPDARTDEGLMGRYSLFVLIIHLFCVVLSK